MLERPSPCPSDFPQPSSLLLWLPLDPSTAVWRVFWPSMHMRWQLEERITDPASLRAGCRKVFLLHSDVYFSPVLYFSVVLYLFNFVVIMDYRSQAFPAAAAWLGRRWGLWECGGSLCLVHRRVVRPIPGQELTAAWHHPGRGGGGLGAVQCAGVSMDKKKLVRKVQTIKTIEDFGSCVIRTCMAIFFASSTVQLAASCFSSGFSRTGSHPILDSRNSGLFPLLPFVLYNLQGTLPPWNLQCGGLESSDRILTVLNIKTKRTLFFGRIFFLQFSGFF